MLFRAIRPQRDGRGLRTPTRRLASSMPWSPSCNFASRGTYGDVLGDSHPRGHNFRRADREHTGRAGPRAGPEGCIAQASRTGSLTDDTGAGNVPSPSTAGVEANSSEPVNAYMLLDATAPAGGGVQREAGERTSYALEGLASELANHKGHRVEIVGQLLPRLPAVSGPKSPAASIQRIAVQTVKMVSAQCESRHTR